MRCVAALRRGVGVAVLLLALLAQPCIAQKTFKNWYFGRFVPDEGEACDQQGRAGIMRSARGAGHHAKAHSA